jgi:hypothetical protein
MTRATTRAERHVRLESVMEPWLGYCRECRQTWPCLYVQGQRDALAAIQEAWDKHKRGNYHFVKCERCKGYKAARLAIKGDSE